MLDVYCKQIRCVLELAVVVWTPGLTKAESYQIERVQKCALHAKLGQNMKVTTKQQEFQGWKNYMKGGSN